jgi:hypothetical protein
MMRPQSQRVHEARGAGRCMAGRPRLVLALGTGTVVLMAGIAGLGSGEHTLTLAIGALGATLTGAAWLLLAGQSGEGQRSIGHATSSDGASHVSVDTIENLPDPMASNMDMPL